MTEQVEYWVTISDWQSVMRIAIRVKVEGGSGYTTLMEWSRWKGTDAGDPTRIGFALSSNTSRSAYWGHNWERRDNKPYEDAIPIDIWTMVVYYLTVHPLEPGDNGVFDTESVIVESRDS